MALIRGIPKSVRPGTGIKGMDIVMNNLRREIVKIKGRNMKGLIESAIIIRRDMDKTSPLIPIDTGNLRQSWFTSPLQVKGNPGLIIGFNANYAVFVHENVGANFKRPGAGAKFFEASLKRNKMLILETIRNNAYIK